LSERPAGLVLITRPEPGARETLTRLAALGRPGLCAPMLIIAPRTLRPPRAAQAVLVTSANAIPALPATLRDTPLYAVGDATAARACAAGFTRVVSAGRDAAALAELVAERCAPASGPLLLASGAGQGMALAAALRSLGFRVARRVSYVATPASQLPSAVSASLQRREIDTVLFFSPATARAFAACILRAELSVAGVEALAISTPTAHALAPLPWRRIRVASHPNQEELVALLS
jgi:uroporphyrinogen-III synthase